MIKLKKNYIYYIIFTLLVTMLFVYLKFPSDSVRKYTELKINNGSLPFKVKISSVSLKIPPGISYGEISISYNDMGSKISSITNIYPSFFSFFRKYHVSGDFLGGKLNGIFSKTGDEAEVTLNKLILEKIPLGFISQIPDGLTFSGFADLDFKVKRKGKKTDGKIDFVLKKLVINLVDRPIKSIAIDKVDSACLIKNDTLEIKRLDITGNDFKASIEGSVQRAKLLENSRINLICIILPKTSAIAKYGKLIPFKMIMDSKNRINFRLTGTIKKPYFKL